MSKSLGTINIIFAVADTLICLAAILAFSGAAYVFMKWWIVLFNIVPLMLFCNHTLIIENDIEAAAEDGEGVER